MKVMRRWGNLAMMVITIASGETLAQNNAPSRLAPSLVFIILGPPGSGKTVQSRLLGKKYKIPVVAVSDLIRSEMGKRSALSASLQVGIQSGALLNDDAANQLVGAHLLASNT